MLNMRFQKAFQGWLLLALACTLWWCAPGSAGSTIKTIDDIAVALCEVTVKDDPSLIPPGQTLDTFCHLANVLSGFKAEATGARQRATARLKAAPVLDGKPDAPKD